MDTLVNGVVLFVVGLILARLLSPTDYGIVGLITVFLAVSQAIMDSGLSSALIRKKNCTEIDYNTMFYTNIVFGLITFIGLYFASGPISRFYDKPELSLLTKIMAINLIINSFGLIERTILTKNLNFRTQAKISVLSSLFGGVVAIVFAYYGFGYWSLAVKTLLENFGRVVLYRYHSSWKPKLQYSIESFKDMFGFGVKLLASSLINTIYNNIYKVVIGKSFSITELGFYSRAEQFNNLPSTNITSAVQRVSYPVLASMSDNQERFRAGYRKMIKLTCYLTSLAMFGLMICSKEVVLLLIGQKWAPSIPFLQVMCIAGTFYPLHSLNLSMMNAMNRSDLQLRVEIYKKFLVVPIIIVCIRYSLIALVWGMVFNSFLAFFVNSMYSARLINYSSIRQLWDIIPSLLLNGTIALIAFLSGEYLTAYNSISLLIKMVVVIALTIAVGQIGKFEEYLEIKNIAKEQYQRMKTSFSKPKHFA